jgi:hypothetical protein
MSRRTKLTRRQIISAEYDRPRISEWNRSWSHVERIAAIAERKKSHITDPIVKYGEMEKTMKTWKMFESIEVSISGRSSACSQLGEVLRTATRKTESIQPVQVTGICPYQVESARIFKGRT